MAGKYFTKEDIRKMMTEKVKDYLDQGWYFNFRYMRCSNGYEFAAVTDGKDTVVVYIRFDWLGETSNLNVEKFTDSNNEYENIWLESGRGEILETTQFLYKDMTETYVIVHGYNSKERLEKRHERSANRIDFKDKDVSEPMKEVLANYIKTKGIPGLKRFKVSDIWYGYYDPISDEYTLKIRINRIRIKRGSWDVKVL